MQVIAKASRRTAKRAGGERESPGDTVPPVHARPNRRRRREEGGKKNKEPPRELGGKKGGGE